MSKELAFTVHPFRADCTDKEQAIKVLEEAAEAYGAYQDVEFSTCIVKPLIREKWAVDLLADELADCITACANMADRYGIDMQTALERCEQKNRERGWYDDGEVDE